MVKTLGIRTPFRNGQPGKDWFIGLKRRHPDFVTRKPEATSTPRLNSLNHLVMQDYFSKLGDTLAKLQSETKVHAIWNMDETNFRLEHAPTMVCARKGSKVLPARTATSKESVSVVATVNAAGQYMPPMIIIKGKTYRSRNSWNVQDSPSRTHWAYQKNAYMTEALGVEWFEKVFLQYCGLARPQVLILDGHGSHTTLEMIEIARANNIQLVALPPHSTHLLQPLDRGVFKSLKTHYNNCCSRFMSESPFNNINHQTWPKLFTEAFTLSFSQKTSFPHSRQQVLIPLICLPYN